MIPRHFKILCKANLKNIKNMLMACSDYTVYEFMEHSVST